MLTFLTLLLGIVWGPREIELAAPANAASVQILLDGEKVASATEPPWRFVVDLGPAPAPHHLDAVARDARGVEIARVRQVVNVPRPEVEAVLALLPGQGGKGRVARLAWEGATGGPPAHVALSFDGKPLPAADLQRIELPSYVPQQLHFLRASLDFGRRGRAEAEITFGGRNRDETSKALTAVPVRVLRDTPLAPEAMAGWLTARGEALRVVAVEEGEASIVFVVDAGARDAFNGMGRGSLVGTRAGRFNGNPEVRIVAAYPEVEQGVRQTFDNYNMSFPQLVSRGMVQILAGSAVPSGGPFCPRHADAVVAAGLRASTWSHPRAVVLLVSGDPDSSRLSASHARAYVQDLGVPLVVWTVGSAAPQAAMAWGGGRRVRSRGDVTAAVRDLEAEVARQRIVWVEGQHLLRTIAVTADAPAGVEVVR